MWFLESMVSEDKGSNGQNCAFLLWKISFSLLAQGEQWSGWPHILRVVGRGSLLSLSHEKELFKKNWGFIQKRFFQDKSSVGNTLPEKDGLNQNKQKRKKFFMPDYGWLECVTLSNHLYSHSSRSVPSISYIGWLSLGKCWEKSVRLYIMPDVPIFPKNGTSQVHTRMPKIHQTTI